LPDNSKIVEAKPEEKPEAGKSEGKNEKE